MRGNIDIRPAQNFRNTVLKAYQFLSGLEFHGRELPSIEKIRSVQHELEKYSHEYVKAEILLDWNFHKHKRYYVNELKDALDINFDANGVQWQEYRHNYIEMVEQKLSTSNMSEQEKRDYRHTLRQLKLAFSYNINGMKEDIVDIWGECEKRVSYDVLELFENGDRYNKYIEACRREGVSDREMGALYLRYGAKDPKGERIAKILHDHLAELGIAKHKLRTFQKGLQGKFIGNLTKA